MAVMFVMLHRSTSSGADFRSYLQNQLYSHFKQKKYGMSSYPIQEEGSRFLVLNLRLDSSRLGLVLRNANLFTTTKKFLLQTHITRSTGCWKTEYVSVNFVKFRTRHTFFVSGFVFKRSSIHYPSLIFFQPRKIFAFRAIHKSSGNCSSKITSLL